MSNTAMDDLEAIRDGIAEHIDAVTIPHEQRECVDFDLAAVAATYYPALAIAVGRGEYLDLVVYNGKIAVVPVEEFAGEFYFDDPGAAWKRLRPFA